MSNESCEEYFQKNEKRITAVIKNRAWEWHKKTSIPYDELIALGNYWYCVVYPYYKPEGDASFSTFLSLCLDKELEVFVTRWMRFDFKLSDSCYYPSTISNSIPESPEASVKYTQLIASLSTEAQTIINILLESPDEFMEAMTTNSPKKIRGALRRHLRETGWKWTVIGDGFREIKEALR